MNRLLARFFHLTRHHAPDGLTQPQREAVVDLLNLCRISDHKLLPQEEFVEAVELGGFDWESDTPIVVYAATSLLHTEKVNLSADARATFLQGVSDRLGTSEFKVHAITVCKEMFLADGEFAPSEQLLYREIKHAFGWPDSPETNGVHGAG